MTLLSTKNYEILYGPKLTKKRKWTMLKTTKCKTLTQKDSTACVHFIALLLCSICRNTCAITTVLAKYDRVVLCNFEVWFVPRILDEICCCQHRTTSGSHDELNERKLVIFRFVLTEIYPSENAIFYFYLFNVWHKLNVASAFPTAFVNPKKLEIQNYKSKKVELFFGNTTFLEIQWSINGPLNT